LISKGIEFTPTGDMHFKAKDPMAVYFEVYEPLLAYGPLLPGGKKAQVLFEMRVVNAKTGEVKSDTGFRPADVFVNADSAVIPISEQVAISSLSRKRPEFPSGTSVGARANMPSWLLQRKRALDDRYAVGERCRRSDG
jgi:hypothetical protein